MSNHHSLNVSMESLKELAKVVSTDVAICIRGRHAIGKSEGVYQVAAELRDERYRNEAFCRKATEALRFERGFEKVLRKHNATVWKYEFGVPVVERRLSQMTEGDMIGLPFLENTSMGSQATSFKPCDWLVNAADFPVVLFLDERNRALEQVKQAVFQIADSKAYYSLMLHEGTRVIIAENVGDEYTVQQQDPAEISRTLTVELDPTVDEWLKYASKICDDALIEFIRQNKECLEHKGIFDPLKKYPDRRAWVRLDAELQRANLYETPEAHIFYVLSCASVGVEIGMKFHSFCKSRDRQVSAEEILKDWTKAKKKLGVVTTPKLVECSLKVSKKCEKHTLNDKEVEQMVAFMKDLPGEVLMNAWTGIANNEQNLLKVHPYVSQLLLEQMSLNEKKSEEDDGSGSASAPKTKKTRSR